MEIFRRLKNSKSDLAFIEKTFFLDRSKNLEGVEYFACGLQRVDNADRK